MNFNFQKALDIVSEKLNSWLETLVSMSPNIIVAVLVLLFFFVIARVASNLFQRVIHRFSDKVVINNLFRSIIHITIVVIGLIIALDLLHLDQTVSSILAGAGIIGLAIGFAFQDISANFISGVLLALRKPIHVGDIIETKHFMGKVEKIDLRVTVIRTFQGLHVIIPNKDVLQNAVTNYTKTSDRRVDLEIGVSYAEDLEKVQKIAVEAIKDQDFILEGKEVKAYFNSFGDSSINFKLMFWIHYPGEPGYLHARSEAIIAIRKAFKEHDITIPFPIRTLDFGIKGGEKLSEMRALTQ